MSDTENSFKVFFSWQKDLPNPTNRTFIEDVLEDVIKQIGVRPVMKKKHTIRSIFVQTS
jgi:hypothetical protein